MRYVRRPRPRTRRQASHRVPSRPAATGQLAWPGRHSAQAAPDRGRPAGPRVPRSGCRTPSRYFRRPAAAAGNRRLADQTRQWRARSVAAQSRSRGPTCRRTRRSPRRARLDGPRASRLASSRSTRAAVDRRSWRQTARSAPRHLTGLQALPAIEFSASDEVHLPASVHRADLEAKLLVDGDHVLVSARVPGHDPGNVRSVRD